MYDIFKRTKRGSSNESGRKLVYVQQEKPSKAEKTPASNKSLRKILKTSMPPPKPILRNPLVIPQKSMPSRNHRSPREVQIHNSYPGVFEWYASIKTTPNQCSCTGPVPRDPRIRNPISPTLSPISGWETTDLRWSMDTSHPITSGAWWTNTPWIQTLHLTAVSTSPLMSSVFMCNTYILRSF